LDERQFKRVERQFKFIHQPDFPGNKLITTLSASTFKSIVVIYTAVTNHLYSFINHAYSLIKLLPFIIKVAPDYRMFVCLRARRGAVQVPSITQTVETLEGQLRI